MWTRLTQAVTSPRVVLAVGSPGFRTYLVPYSIQVDEVPTVTKLAPVSSQVKTQLTTRSTFQYLPFQGLDCKQPRRQRRFKKGENKRKKEQKKKPAFTLMSCTEGYWWQVLFNQRFPCATRHKAPCMLLPGRPQGVVCRSLFCCRMWEYAVLSLHIHG